MSTSAGTNTPEMSVDLSEFEAEGKKRSLCTFAITAFTPEQRVKLDVVLDSRPDITHRAISRVLAKWGFKVDDAIVSRHRRRECSCPPVDKKDN